MQGKGQGGECLPVSFTLIFLLYPPRWPSSRQSLNFLHQFCCLFIPAIGDSSYRLISEPFLDTSITRSFSFISCWVPAGLVVYINPFLVLRLRSECCFVHSLFLFLFFLSLLALDPQRICHSSTNGVTSPCACTLLRSTCQKPNLKARLGSFEQRRCVGWAAMMTMLRRLDMVCRLEHVQVHAAAPDMGKINRLDIATLD